MRVVIRTERDTFTVSNVVQWFHGVDSSLVVVFESRDELIRRCWRNWVGFDVFTHKDEKPTESEVSKESEDGKELLKWADYALRLAQANSGEKRRHNVTVALTDLEEWAKLAKVDMNEVHINLVVDPERRLIEARQAIQLELDDSFIPIAIAHLRAVLEHMEGEKPEEQANSQAIPKTAEYAVGDTVVTFEIG